jgi:radical SAM superfamily enzyme YgiQ (UPF0313 family)
MKTLLLHPHLTDTFWSLPETIRFMKKKAVFIPLGLVTVAAMLPRDWPMRLVDLAIRPVRGEDWEWAEVVMISSMIVHRESVKALIATAKKRGKRVIAGGPYPSALPKEVLAAGADIVMRGEAENQMAPLIAAITTEDSGIVLEAAEKPDLSRCPVPRFDLLEQAAYIVPAVQTSRGCPFDCEFCDVTRLYGRRPRYKSPRQVIAELEALKKLGWRGQLLVADDNFIGNRKKGIGADSGPDRLAPDLRCTLFLSHPGFDQSGPGPGTDRSYDRGQFRGGPDRYRVDG